MENIQTSQVKAKANPARLAILLSVFLCLGWWAFLGNPLDPIRPETVQRIRLGMTEKNVIALFGRKADWELARRSGTLRCWTGRNWSVAVEFDTLDKVTGSIVKEG